MEISCLVTPTCHIAVQSGEKHVREIEKTPHPTTEARSSGRIVPRTSEERIACLKLGIAGAVVIVGTPAAMCALHLLGVW